MTKDEAATMARIEERLESALDYLTDHEKRLRSIEAWRWIVTGASGAAGALMGTYGPTLVVKLSGG